MSAAEILQAAAELGPRGHVSFYGEDAKVANRLLTLGLIEGEPTVDQVTVLGITAAGLDELRKLREQAEARTVKGIIKTAGRGLLRLLVWLLDHLVTVAITVIGTLLFQRLRDSFHS